MKKLYFFLVAMITMFAANAAPASSLYLIGEPAGGWDPLKGTEMEKTADGVFELDVNLTKNMWFGFSQKLGTSASDWSTMNGSRYGAPSDSYTPTLDTPISLLYPSENSFQLGKGEYHFKVDTNTNTFTVTGQEVEDPTANVLYLRGKVSNWETSDDYKFTKDGDTYTLTVPSLYGEFKIANSDYSQQFAASSPVELGVATIVENLGYTSSKLAIDNAENVTITFVKESNSKGVMTITGTQQWTAPEKAYYSASLDGNWAFNTELTAKGNGVFAAEGIEVTAANGYMTFTTGLMENWTVADGMRYGSGADDVNVVSQQSYTASAGSDKAFVLSAGKWNVELTFTQTATTVKFVKDGGDDPTPELPATVYLVGSYNNWATTNLLSAEGVEGVYTFSKVELSASEDGENSYFSFVTATGADWDADVNSSNRYGAATKDEAISAGTPATVVLYQANVNASSAASWKVAAGEYNITLNLNDMTVLLDSTDALEAIEAAGAEADAVYYNLQGVRVANPAQGLYIKVCGDKVAKVYVK